MAKRRRIAFTAAERRRILRKVALRERLSDRALAEQFGETYGRLARWVKRQRVKQRGGPDLT